MDSDRDDGRKKDGIPIGLKPRVKKSQPKVLRTSFSPQSDSSSEITVTDYSTNNEDGRMYNFQQVKRVWDRRVLSIENVPSKDKRRASSSSQKSITSPHRKSTISSPLRKSKKSTKIIENKSENKNESKSNRISSYQIPPVSDYPLSISDELSESIIYEAGPTLKNVSVIFRHGEIIPSNIKHGTTLTELQSNPGSVSRWPKDNEFYDRFGGKLTGHGYRQSIRLSRILLEGYSDLINNGIIRGFCTSTERSLSSMDAILTDMVNNDRHISWRYPGEKLQQGTIDVIIGRRMRDPLLSNDKGRAECQSLYRRLWMSSPTLIQANEKHEYRDLGESLYNLTGEKTLLPYEENTVEETSDLIHRISTIGKVIDPYQLKYGERAKIKNAQRIQSLSKYHTAGPLESLTKWNATMIMNEITDHMLESRNTFTLYSVHGSNLLSIMSYLSIIPDDSPQPGDHMIIENWITPKNEQYVKFLVGGLGMQTVDLHWEPGSSYKRISTLSGGNFNINQWVEMTTTTEYRMIRDFIFFKVDYTLPSVDPVYMSYFDNDRDGYLSISDLEVYSSYYISNFVSVSVVYQRLARALGIRKSNDLKRGIPLYTLMNVMPSIRWHRP